MGHIFSKYEPWKGDIPSRISGVLISMETGKSITYGMDKLADRGKCFLDPGDDIYEGQIILAFQSTRGELAPTFTALIVFTYTITIVYALVLRNLSSPTAYTAFTWVQVGVDVVLETVLIARTGGVESPFAVLYVITVTEGSLVPHRRVGIVTGAGCTFLFGFITMVQYFGVLNASSWLPPSKLEGPEALQTFEVYGLAFLVVGFL